MSGALDKGALQFACQRVEDFAVVNFARPVGEKQEATTLWLEYLGLEEDLRAYLYNWLDGFYPAWDGQVLLGIAVGLLVNEFNNGTA